MSIVQYLRLFNENEHIALFEQNLLLVFRLSYIIRFND